MEETSSAAGPTAAGGPAAQASATSGSVKMLNLALMINGTLGDKGFFDSAKAGTDRAKAELGAKVRVVEERDAANWESVLRQLAQGDYDVIVLGTFQMVDALNNVAREFQIKFILFDATVDQPNVANIVYAQNEGSFLAGALAGCVVSRSEMKGLSGDKVIGAVGGLDIDVINDFIIGYEQGAKYVDPEIEVLKAYNSGANAFEDRIRARAGPRSGGQGRESSSTSRARLASAALRRLPRPGRYSVGVDSNQALSGSVLTSMLKRVDNSVFDLIQIEATARSNGAEYPYGIQNEGVGLAEMRSTTSTSRACRDQVEKAKRTSRAARSGGDGVQVDEPLRRQGSGRAGCAARLTTHNAYGYNMTHHDEQQAKPSYRCGASLCSSPACWPTTRWTSTCVAARCTPSSARRRRQEHADEDTLRPPHSRLRRYRGGRRGG
ncbi:MAG: BMP family ABC transporter substrate-binding protein [Chloroflexia bacterium]